LNPISDTIWHVAVLVSLSVIIARLNQLTGHSRKPINWRTFNWPVFGAVACICSMVLFILIYYAATA
jgi:hypothetical protein